MASAGISRSFLPASCLGHNVIIQLHLMSCFLCGEGAHTFFAFYRPWLTPARSGQLTAASREWRFFTANAFSKPCHKGWDRARTEEQTLTSLVVSDGNLAQKWMMITTEQATPWRHISTRVESRRALSHKAPRSICPPLPTTGRTRSAPPMEQRHAMVIVSSSFPQVPQMQSSDEWPKLRKQTSRRQKKTTARKGFKQREFVPNHLKTRTANKECKQQQASTPEQYHSKSKRNKERKDNGQICIMSWIIMSEEDGTADCSHMNF